MEKTYGIRITFNHGNAISLDLKGCGTLYIKPGKDYYFTNAPIEFTDYLAQLRRLGITYKITPDRKGCYQTVDLTTYRVGDARSVLSELRRASVINEDEYLTDEAKKAKDKKNNAIKKEEKKVVLSSDDVINKENIINLVQPEELSSDNVDNSITDDVKTIEEESKTEAIVEEQEISAEQATDDTQEQENYSEDELNKLSKNKLLEIAKSFGINDITEINTKKEIRDAIINFQK